MLNRKLLEVLSRIPNEKRKQLRDFLESPYFNHSFLAQDTIRLYDHIIRYKAQENHSALSKDAVFKKFYPELEYRENSKNQLDSLTSELYRLVRLFLAQKEMECDSAALYESLALARFYRKYGLEERFWQIIKTMKKKQQSASLRDAGYYYQQFRIEDEELTFRTFYNTFEDGMNLKSAHNSLDLYYSILKMEFTFAADYQAMFTNIEQPYNAPLNQCILGLIENNAHLNIPINRIYRLLIYLLRDPDSDEALHQLEQLLEENRSHISEERFREFLVCYRFVLFQRYRRSGDEASSRHIFDVYREHLEQGYFYIDGMIPHTAFRNFIVLALKINATNWVENFLKTHPPEHIGGTRFAAEIHSLNWAEYLFYLKNYDEALEKLVYRPYENPAIGIMADLLLVKIYFETGSDLLESRMKALDQKIRRAKLNRDVKIRYYNFLKKLDKVIKYSWQNQNPKVKRLIAEITKTGDIAAREWLLEKLKR